MSTNAPSTPPTPEEQLQAWKQLENELGVRGPDAVRDMIRSLEAQLLSLYADLDPEASK